jgi:hypothetical protein
MKEEAVILGIALATEVALGFSAFEPSPVTCRHLATNKIAVKTIRYGEAVAAGFSIAVGTSASFAIKSPIPLIFAIVGTLFMIGVYEWAITHPEPIKETVSA